MTGRQPTPAPARPPVDRRLAPAPQPPHPLTGWMLSRRRAANALPMRHLLPHADHHGYADRPRRQRGPSSNRRSNEGADWGDRPWPARPGGAEAAEIGGARLAYTERGCGEPIVFVHGSLSDLTIWPGNARHDGAARRGPPGLPAGTRRLPSPPGGPLVGRVHLPPGGDPASRRRYAASCSRSPRSSR